MIRCQLSALGLHTVGLTAPTRVSATRSTNAYTEVLSYSELERLAVSDQAAFLDIAGDATVAAAVGHALAHHLQRHIVIGATHHDAPPAEAATSSEPVGPVAELFDTAQSEAQYIHRHGRAALQALERRRS